LTQWLMLLLRRGQELQVFRDDLPDSLMIDILMSMGMSIDRWMLARWENTQAVERIEISQKTFELFVRVLAKHS
jgi:hypothetical protein